MNIAAPQRPKTSIRGIHTFKKARGVTLIAASAPTRFVEDTPTAVLVRQALGAVAEFKRRPLSPNWRRRAGGSGRLDVWSWPLMGHPYRVIRRMRYGPGSARERHDD